MVHGLFWTGIFCDQFGGGCAASSPDPTCRERSICIKFAWIRRQARNTPSTEPQPETDKATRAKHVGSSQALTNSKHFGVCLGRGRSLPRYPVVGCMRLFASRIVVVFSSLFL